MMSSYSIDGLYCLLKKYMKGLPIFQKSAIAAQRVKRKVNQKCHIVRYKTDAILFPKKMPFYCPCCGLKIRSFVSGGYRDRPGYFDTARYDHTEQNVLCPVCRSLPRHRILAAWSDSHKELYDSRDILYFAPEYGMILWMKRNNVSFTSVDLYRNADLKLDIQNTGLPDQSWDVIICNHVLEHVEDFRTALNELYRILRPGGFLICSFPMDSRIELLDEDPSVQAPEERRQRYGQSTHRRVFGMRAELFLREAGFAVERIEGENYPKEILPIVGPADYDINLLFRCIKKA